MAANSKWTARTRVLEIITAALREGVDITPPPIDPEMAEAAAEVLGVHVSSLLRAAPGE